MDFFTIDTVTVSGGETISHDEIKGISENMLQGNYLLLIPRRFTYLYPHDAIASTIQAIDKVRTVSVDKVSSKELHITFDEYVPHALWCTSSSERSDCYFINSEGYAFAPAPSLEGSTFLRYVFENNNILGKKNVLSADDIAHTDTFAKALADKANFRIGEVTHTSVGDIVYHIIGGGELLTAGDMNINDVFDNVTSVLDSKEFNHLKPGNFKYIDLRFGNKVFVNEEVGDTSTSTIE